MSKNLKSLCLEALYASNPESKLALLSTITHTIFQSKTHQNTLVPSLDSLTLPPYELILEALQKDFNQLDSEISQSCPTLSITSPHRTIKGSTKNAKPQIYELSNSLKSPTYAGFCTIAHPRKIRRPKHIKSPQALAKVLHSIVHIEYSAIDLALDALRFCGLPIEFYADWLEVALEEGLHFKLLHEALRKLGFSYGDFEVHSLLFDAQCATPKLSDRMGLLHRGLEANGLDSNPFVMEKIKAFESEVSEDLHEALSIILRDEIKHVRKGDKWWRFSTNAHSTQDFIELLARYETFRPRPKSLNYQARLQAGFTLDELERLERL